MPRTKTPRLHVCDRCGAESVRAAGFVRQSHFGRSRWRCRPCEELERDRRFPRELRWTAATAIGAGALLVALPADGTSVPWLRALAALAINLAVLPMLWMPVVIAAHEAGHWLAGRALGFDAHAVQIGTGRILARFRWFGTPVAFRRNPVVGHVLMAIRSERWLRLRCLGMLAAGPATHVLWLLLATRLGDVLGVGLHGWTEGVRPLSALAAVNWALLVANLLPLRIGDLVTDGAQILLLPFLSRTQRDAIVAQRWSLPARLALIDRRLDEAHALADEGLRLHPADLALQMVWSAVAIERGAFDAAQAQLEKSRARPDLDDDQRAMIANDLAWCLHVRGRPQDVADADALSQEAARRLGEQPAVQSTRAGVLVDLGRAEEAWALLANALEKVEPAGARASMLCDLARAEHLLGRPQVARTRVAEARALDARCVLLARAEAELRAAPRPAPPPAPSPPEPRAVREGRRPGVPRLRWLAWLLLPIAAFAWSCGPSFVVGSVLAGLTWHVPSSDAPTAEQQRECRASLGRLGRLEKLAALWPPVRRVWDSYGLELQQANLLECTGDLAAARALLWTAIARGEAALPEGPVDWQRAPEEASSAFQLSGTWTALAALEERAGDREAARAALERVRELGPKLDGGAEWGASTLGAVAALAAHVARSGEPERADAMLREALRAAEQAGSEDATLLPLLQAHADLLQQSGRTGEAEVLYARIGRVAGSFDPFD